MVRSCSQEIQQLHTDGKPNYICAVIRVHKKEHLHGAAVTRAEQGRRLHEKEYDEGAFVLHRVQILQSDFITEFILILQRKTHTCLTAITYIHVCVRVCVC